MDISAFSYLNAPKPHEKTGIVNPNQALLHLADRARSGNLVIMAGSGCSASAGLALCPEIGDVLKLILDKKDSKWDDVSELALMFVERLEKQLRQPDAAKVKLIFLINNILKFSKNTKKKVTMDKFIPVWFVFRCIPFIQPIGMIC